MAPIVEVVTRGAYPWGYSGGVSSPAAPSAEPSAEPIAGTSPGTTVAGTAATLSVRNRWAERVRTLHPGWFASVMGTAVLAVASAGNPGGTSELEPFWDVVAAGLLVVATGLAIVLLAMYSARWLFYRESALADLRDPVLGALIGTVPGGLLVLSAASIAAGPLIVSDGFARGVATALLAVGAPLAIVVGVVWAEEVVDNAPIDLAKVTGTWFIPPVIAVLVPLAGAPLVVDWPGTATWLWLGYAFAGAGLLLFVLIAGLVIARLALNGVPPAPLAPAVWIALGPPGAGGVALVRLSDAAEASGISTEALVVATVALATGMLGFAFWWLAFAAMVLRRQLVRGRIPYSPAWWAWTFPLGAMSSLTLVLGAQWGSTVVEVVGVVLLVGTLAVWTMVAVRTLRAMRTGEAWRRAR